MEGRNKEVVVGVMDSIYSLSPSSRLGVKVALTGTKNNSMDNHMELRRMEINSNTSLPMLNPPTDSLRHTLAVHRHLYRLHRAAR